MIIDTSAFTAVVLEEHGWERLREAMATSDSVIPAPVLTELQLVLSKRPRRVAEVASALVDWMLTRNASIAAFEHLHTDITAVAREKYGKGNGAGGLLNFGDLMVYAIARNLKQPLLCTGRDFASTDLEIHPASRIDP